MAGIICSTVRFGVIGALGLGSAFLVAEAAAPGSARAIVGQAKQHLSSVITNNIDDPVALRAQLRELEAQYPEKISQVRSDLNELRSQRSKFDRELAIASRVVELADADLGALAGLLDQAEEARQNNGYAVVRVSFDNRSMDMESAYGKANEIRELRSSYAQRSADIERDLGYLQQQEERLADLLGKLETERASFQQQLWQLDRQVDAIARNERMLEMMEKREATIDELSPYTANSLDQVTSRLSEIRAEQEDRMASLGRSSDTESYLERAKGQVDADHEAQSLMDGDFNNGVIEIAPPEIEVTPDGIKTKGSSPLASRID